MELVLWIKIAVQGLLAGRSAMVGDPEPGFVQQEQWEDVKGTRRRVKTPTTGHW